MNAVRVPSIRIPAKTPVNPPARKNLLRRCRVFLALIFVFSSGTHAALATVVSFWKITNHTSLKVTDAELTFARTGGTISDPEIVSDTPGATIQTTQMGNGARIEWAAGLPPGADTDFFFFTDSKTDITFDSGTWTQFGFPVADITKTDGTIQKLSEANVPEPSGLVLLLTALAGFWSWRRLRSDGVIRLPA